MTIQALYTAATGMSATQTNLDVIANNLANASTTGFKESRMNFADLCYQNYQLPGSLDTNGQPIPIGMQVGTGVRTNGTEIDQTQGSFIQTNGTLDMAISGLGFFQIQDPQSGQILYTRAGNFAINANGQVVLASPDIGRFLQPTLTIPPVRRTSRSRATAWSPSSSPRRRPRPISDKFSSRASSTPKV